MVCTLVRELEREKKKGVGGERTILNLLLCTLGMSAKREVVKHVHLDSSTAEQCQCWHTHNRIPRMKMTFYEVRGLVRGRVGDPRGVVCSDFL